MAEDGHDREQLSLIKPEGYKVYSRRWLMLAIFATFAMSNYFLWGQYGAISDSVANYYNVSLDVVDLLSIVNLITYVVAILPVMWLTEKFNLKFVLVVGAIFQSVGCWIRYAGTCVHSIPLNFLGQILCAMGQPCCFGMSSQMAGTWFGIKEVSLANGIGFSAVEVGVGLSIMISPLVVQNGPELESQMKDLFLYTAIAVTLILPLTMFVFEAEPPLPPSRPRMNVDAAGKQVKYSLSLKVLLTNRNFLLILFANTFNLGFLSLIEFKLNETIILAFRDEDSSEIVKNIGLSKIVTCIIGPLLVGYLLDISKSFRLSAIFTSLCTAATIAFFTISLYLTEYISVLVAMTLYWFFAACLIIVVFEYAVELTYPEPEIMSSGLLNAAGYGFAIAMMFLYDVILEATNNVYTTMTIFCVTLFIAFVFTIFIEPDYRRQNADRDNFEDVSISESDSEIRQ